MEGEERLCTQLEAAKNVCTDFSWGQISKAREGREGIPVKETQAKVQSWQGSPWHIQRAPRGLAWPKCRVTRRGGRGKAGRVRAPGTSSAALWDQDFA